MALYCADAAVAPGPHSEAVLAVAMKAQPNASSTMLVALTDDHRAALCEQKHLGITELGSTFWDCDMGVAGFTRQLGTWADMLRRSDGEEQWSGSVSFGRRSNSCVSL